jgi:AcrR family transcriptional regulator
MAPDTRQRIVEEALKLFSRQGYGATSVAQIEEAAGLKPGAGGLYAHFDSKAELLEAAVERSVALAKASYALHAALPLGDARAELRLMARGSLLLLDTSQDWIRMALKDGDQFPELFAGAREQVVEPVYRLIAEWLASKADEGELAEHDSAAVADVLFGAVNNYWLQTRVFDWRPNDVDEERFIAAWTDLALRLAPEP